MGLPILLFVSETWSLSQAKSRVHTSCLRSILGVKLSDCRSNAHVRAKCGATTLATIISTNRLRWWGHVGRMGHGRLPHIALFSSLYGVKKRPSRGRPRIRWEECVCADLRAIAAFLWRIGRLSVSFGVLGGRGSGSFLTQEQSSSSKIWVSQGEGVCKQQHSMQITTGPGEQPPLLGATPEPHKAVAEPRCLNFTHVLAWVFRAPLTI
jgi:hypothetical protein